VRDIQIPSRFFVGRAAGETRLSKLKGLDDAGSMNLNTIAQVKRPSSPDEVGPWRPSYAWLAGGTWLFSEPQVTTDTLIDLDSLGWPALTPTPDGLEIAATCRVADLHAFRGPPEWKAVPLFRDCINAFLMSFKIWNAATIGGNIVMSLPAGAGLHHHFHPGQARQGSGVPCLGPADCGRAIEGYRPPGLSLRASDTGGAGGFHRHPAL